VEEPVSKPRLSGNGHERLKHVHGVDHVLLTQSRVGWRVVGAGIGSDQAEAGHSERERDAELSDAKDRGDGFCHGRGQLDNRIDQGQRSGRASTA
jgi:hypothetical protein